MGYNVVCRALRWDGQPVTVRLAPPPSGRGVASGKDANALSDLVALTANVGAGGHRTTRGFIPRRTSGPPRITPPPDVSFWTYQLTSTKIAVNKGYCIYAGTETEKTETAVTATGDGAVYVSLDFETATWTGPSFAVTASIPASTDSVEVYILCDVLWDATNSVITSIFRRHSGDIRETRA